LPAFTAINKPAVLVLSCNVSTQVLVYFAWKLH